jgi:tetratricopeptide (TPR) repeat protein
VALYKRLNNEVRSPGVLVGHGLALIALGNYAGALSILNEIDAEPDSLPGLVAPLLRAYVLGRLGADASAAPERKAFVAGLDDLRGRLEAELGQELLDAFLQWVETRRENLPAEMVEELQSAIYERITRPLPHYYRGVSQLWLGEYSLAEASFEAYLDMLPDAESPTKARELLILARNARAPN